MNIKTILGVAAVTAVGSTLFGSNKVSKYGSLMENLEFEVKGARNIKLKNGIVYVDVDLAVINPTPIAIDIPGNNLVVKKIHFFTASGKKLGIAEPNISDINVPANGTRKITNIPARISLVTLGNNFSDVLTIMSNPKENLKIETEISVFGKSFTV